jgi:hypothetical protein
MARLVHLDDPNHIKGKSSQVSHGIQVRIARGLLVNESRPRFQIGAPPAARVAVPKTEETLRNGPFLTRRARTWKVIQFRV